MLKKVTQIGREYEGLIKNAGFKLPRIDYELMSSQTYRTNGMWKTWAYRPNYGVVRINPNLANESDLRETIAHELAHAVIDPNNKGHSSRWKSICRRVYRVVGLDPERVNRTNDRDKVGEEIQFRMTEYGASLQKHKKFRDTNTVHTVTVVGSRQRNKYSRLQRSGIIEII